MENRRRVVEKRLKECGVELPTLKPPGGSYAPVRSVKVGDGRQLLFFSGHVPWTGNDGKTGKPQYLYRGSLPSDFSIEEAQTASRLCAEQILSRLSYALDGNLGKVNSFINLKVFVKSNANFEKQSLVGNGASDFINKIFGEKVGPHTRSAVGVSSLPKGVCVEIEATVECEC